MRGAATMVVLLIAAAVAGQQDGFRAKLGVQAGVVRSLGDIGSGLQRFDPQRSAMIGLSYERFLGYGVSLFGGYERLWLSGNDRETGRLDRSLNFLADVHTGQVGLRFHADNGRLLNYDARFAPFFQVGIGAGTYDVFGDLYDDNGARYNFWSDGTIRSLPENAPDAASAQVVDQNGVFETRLTHLATEEGKPRETWFLFIPARLGMKWRISDRFSAEVAYAFNWTFTDRLDDVSGAYPTNFATEELAYISNPAGHTGVRGGNGRNDHFHHLALGLSMGIGRRSHKFRMPPLRAPEPVATVSIPAPAPPQAVPPAPTDTVVRRTTVEVEHVRVGRLEVDTLIIRGAPVVVDTQGTKADVQRAERSLEPDTLNEAAERSKDAVGDMREPRRAEADSVRQVQPRSAPEQVKPEEKEQQGTGTRSAPTEPGSAQTTQHDRGSDARRSTEQPQTIQQRTTERIIERTAPPVVLIQKEVVRDTVVREVQVGEPDTARTAAATTAEDTVKARTTTPSAPLPPEPAPHVRSALEMQRDHAMQMNRMLNDRIHTLERYLAIQEAHGGAATIDSLRQRIAALDAELEAMRSSTDAVPESPIPAGMAILDTVRFASNSFHVREPYRESLLRTAERIVAADPSQVLVTGHTDRSGDAEYNRQLSQRRAEAVAEVLRSAGVPADRIKVKGFGQELARARHDRNERVVVVQVAMDE